jgi:hypothetical protein
VPSRRRRRREQAQAALVDRRGRPISQWKWLTFPVFCALAVGLFAGYNVGLIARGQSRVEQVATLGFAVLFAFAMSQLATRPITEMLLKRRARQQQRGPTQTP